ncbi:movement protein [Chickpea chlorotic stunt virus]|uniref:Movement protein n=1 Tax=Chickpea chlorotic stunt virus TaxID=328430 RepID=Q17S67_9VIRU|nr:movement protein [Chickpea chlorotic stunt virus]AAY90042.1 movement protein [Chickpea chlorotic stunt virus]
MAEGGEIGVLFSGLGAATQWLWSKPLGSHSAEDDEEETVDALQEEAQLEDEGLARHLCFRKTTSRVVPQEVSRSGRVYQTAQLSALEYSGPTMNIKSQWSSWSSSPRPLPPPQGRSLTSLIPTANPLRLGPTSINLESPRMDKGLLQRGLLTESNGTPQTRTSSGYFIKEMEAPPSRGHSGSPSSAKLRIRNR